MMENGERTEEMVPNFISLPWFFKTVQEPPCSLPQNNLAFPQETFKSSMDCCSSPPPAFSTSSKPKSPPQRPLSPQVTAQLQCSLPGKYLPSPFSCILLSLHLPPLQGSLHAWITTFPANELLPKSSSNSKILPNLNQSCLPFPATSPALLILEDAGSRKEHLLVAVPQELGHMAHGTWRTRSKYPMWPNANF